MNNNYPKINHVLYVEEPEFKQTIYLEDQMYSIGRHSNNSIRLYSQEISRHHASLIRKNSVNNQYYYLLIDGDLQERRSQNGILVNGKKKLNHELKHGDVIIFGTENVKAIYQIKEFSDEKINVNDDIFLTKNLVDSYKLYLKFPNEQLENTLIVEEQNLDNKLKNADLNNLASFAELSPNPIIELDFLGNITYLNPAANLNFANILALNNQHPLLSGLNTSYPNKQGKLLTREVKIEEQIFEEYIHYLSENNRIRIYIYDITKRKQAEEMLRYQALHDSLTGLPNRDFFYQKLNFFINQYHQNKQQIALLFIDLDRFKNINDNLSHTTGDLLLQNVAYRFLSDLSSDTFLARWGGDEFTLIIPNIEKIEQVEEIAKAIMNSLKEPFYLDNHTLYISASIGIAIYPQDGKNEETLIKNADAALYRAKAQGRNNYRFYNANFAEESSFLFKIENSLYEALKNNELFLCYQPQINVKSRKIHGLEALLRWEHPELNKISPGKFIPLAEETGLIMPIGEWVLETACRQMKIWQDNGLPNFKVAVNVSVIQFRDENFTKKVIEIIEKTQLNPKFLELEITESILMQDVELATQIIQELGALGITFSLDDFGTGYSSFGYLKKFPFHTIKIDHSFVINLRNNSQDLALISAIITLGKGFNMEIIAEGVETEKQLNLLENLGCEIIQGRWLCEPLKTEEITLFMQKYN